VRYCADCGDPTEGRNLRCASCKRRYNALRNRKWRKANPMAANAAHDRAIASTEAGRMRRKAREAFKYAVRKGRLVRPDRCSKCGVVGAVEGHHDDYTHPLQVTWLCSSCHLAHHGKVLWQ